MIDLQDVKVKMSVSKTSLSLSIKKQRTSFGTVVEYATA